METERLIIRKFEKTDGEGFVALIRDKMASPYAAYDDQYPTDEATVLQILDYFSGSDEFFAVVEKSSGGLIGYVALNAVDEQTRNLGYCLHSAFQGRGYAAEAAKCVIGYAESLGVKRLISGTAQLNLPSVGLLKKLGFIQVGQSKASFASDCEGKPITFIACEFELKIQ